MLRASAAATETEIDFAVVMGNAEDGGGVPDGALLVGFVEAVLGIDEPRLAVARRSLHDALGDAGLVDAAAVIANYSALDRVADATGIPLEPAKEVNTAAIRAELGIDALK
jgi:hypothetical protein